ncbi:MAG TPA: hypothetical protein VKA30_01680 [Actinomycetota bacterium]|nr:hypothetical protein [Actinomycetota bacterium]
MALIDRHLPTFDVCEYHEVLVEAPADTTYRAARGLDLARSRPVRALFGLRAAVSLLTPRLGVAQYGSFLRGGRLSIDDLREGGFVVLEERPGQEIVLGAIGKFWRAAGGVRRIDAADFVPFDQPGYAKGVMNFRVRAARGGASTVSTETRVLCTDAGARRAFHRYWRLIGPFSSLIRRRALAMVKADAERSAEVAAGTMDSEG